MSKKSKIYSLTDEQFKEMIEQSWGYSDCLRKLGLDTHGGSSLDILKGRIRQLNCNITHFKTERKKFLSQLISKKNIKYSLCEILKENSNYSNISRLKQRIIKENLLEYKCDVCGLTEWNDKPISLVLDHINGKNNDHRIENLRFLCPNCHSQTDTFAGKNKEKN